MAITTPIILFQNIPGGQEQSHYEAGGMCSKFECLFLQKILRLGCKFQGKIHGMRYNSSDEIRSMTVLYQ